MSEAKKKDETQEDWDFQIPAAESETPSKKRLKKSSTSARKTPVLNPETAGSQKRKKVRSARDLAQGSGSPKLGIEGGKKRVSRKQMAKNYEIVDRMEATLKAAPIDRLKAGFIDLFLMAGVGAGSYFGFPYARRYVMKFLIQEGINQNLPPEQFKMAIISACALVGVLLFYVFPILIKGKSLGKVFKGLRIGDVKDTMTVSRTKGIFRDLILRPLSFVSVIGIFMMFFNKKKQGLHDLILGTTVFYQDSEEDDD